MKVLELKAALDTHKAVSEERWLEACADKFADDPKKFTERRGFTILDKQSLTNTPQLENNIKQ